MRAAMLFLLAGTGQPDIVAEFERQLAAMRKPIEPDVAPVPKPVDDYVAVRAQAIAESKPFVVGVGCEPPRGKWLTVRVAKLEGFTPPCVALAMPEKGELWKAGTFPEGVTAAAIQAAIAAKNKARLDRLEAEANELYQQFLKSQQPKAQPKKYDPYPNVPRVRSWN